MATLTYNGVTLPYIMVKDMKQEAVRSKDGMDLLYHRFTVTVQSVFHPSILPANQSVQTYMTNFRADLLLPRQTFILDTSEGQDAASPFPNIYNVPGPDTANGPFPLYCNITRLGATTSYYVEYSIQFHVSECPTSPQMPGRAAGSSDWLSNRWSESLTYDSNFVATKTREGTLVIRGDQVTQTLDQQVFLITPPTPPFMKLESVGYNPHSDGLTMDYIFVWKQIINAPPPPATNADGYYAESSPDGAHRFRECYVKLEGPMIGSQSGGAKSSDLVRAAIQVAVLKVTNGQGFRVGDAAKNPNSLPTDIRRCIIKQSLPWKSNWVEVSLLVTDAATIISDFRTGTNIPAIWDYFPGQALSPTGLAVDLTPYGTLAQTVVTAALRNNVNDGVTSNLLQTVTTTPTGQALLVAQAPGGPVIGVTLTTVSEIDQISTPLDPQVAPSSNYKEYQINSKHHLDRNIIQLPISLNNAVQGVPSVMVSVGNPILTRTTEFMISRRNTTPDIPNFQPQDSNTVLLDVKLEPMEVEVEAGNTQVYTLRGCYTWGFLDASLANVTYPPPPYLDDTVAGSVIQPTDLQTDILNPTTANGQGAGIFS